MFIFLYFCILQVLNLNFCPVCLCLQRGLPPLLRIHLQINMENTFKQRQKSLGDDDRGRAMWGKRFWEGGGEQYRDLTYHDEWYYFPSTATWTLSSKEHSITHAHSYHISPLISMRVMKAPLITRCFILLCWTFSLSYVYVRYLREICRSLTCGLLF